MFYYLKDKLLALLAAVIVALCTASIIYIYRIPGIGQNYHNQFLGINFKFWILLRLMEYIVVSIIVVFIYHLFAERRIKKLEDKFNTYLKDLDELNEEWADENHELWEFIENILKERDIKKIKRKAQNLLKSREKNKKSVQL